MKRIFTTLLCIVFFAINGISQKTFTVEQKQSFFTAIPFADLYMYPTFKQGVVYYKGGNTGGGNVNYNYLTKELVFIGANADTLPIADPEEIDSVMVDNDRLYYFEGFVKYDTTVGETKLATGNIFSIVDKKAVGFNGISTTSTSNMDYMQYKLNTSGSMVADEQIVLSKDTILYIGDRMNHFIPVNKKNLYKFYSKKQGELRAYLEQHTVNYSNRANIVSLLLYMGQG